MQNDAGTEQSCAVVSSWQFLLSVMPFVSWFLDGNVLNLNLAFWYLGIFFSNHKSRTQKTYFVIWGGKLRVQREREKTEG